MSMTLAQLQARLDSYLAAEARILESQEYTVGQGSTARRNRRAELEQVRAAITDLRADIAKLEGAARGGRRVHQLRPRA
ncbi:hypothetical protein [Variovorax atrisoli]|uniref:hypothetical protein n=1 Tax=Variovorax atrisoli TaxID=3394203 RepID=UPI000364ABE9|nr:hypothetical protein [Variovorax paradoxus]